MADPQEHAPQPQTLSGASHAVALTQADLERLLGRAIEDTRGGGWGALLVGSFLLLLGLGIGSVIVRDRVATGTAGLRSETAALREEVARLREIALTPVVMSASAEVAPPVAEKVASAQRVEAVLTGDRVAELTARRGRLNEQRVWVQTQLNELAAGGRMLPADEVARVMTAFFEGQLAWLGEERDEAAALSKRQTAMAEAVLDPAADDGTFAAPLQERVERLLAPPTKTAAVEPTPAESNPFDAAEPQAPALPESKPVRGVWTPPPSGGKPSRLPTPPAGSGRGVSIQNGGKAKPKTAGDAKKPRQQIFAVPERGANTTFSPRRTPQPLDAPSPFRFASESKPIAD